MSGPHRELLELWDEVHLAAGCPSVRSVGRAMELAPSRVHDLLRGTALPVDDAQVRALVLALGSTQPADGDDAVALFRAARRNRATAAWADPVEPGGETREPSHVDPEPADEPGAARDGFRPGRRLAWAVAGILVALLAAFAWALLHPSAATPAPGGIVLQDSFDGPLDPAKWLPATRGDLIAVRDGSLHLSVTEADTATAAEARLAPRAVDGYREMTVVVSTQSFERAGPGGGSVSFELADGRQHKLLFGPGVPEPGETAPGQANTLVAALVCSRDSCTQYDDFDPPGQTVLTELTEQVPVRVVQADDGRIQFFARDQLFAQTATGQAALRSFRIELYGAKSESWDITVGSLVVSR